MDPEQNKSVYFVITLRGGGRREVRGGGRGEGRREGRVGERGLPTY